MKRISNWQQANTAGTVDVDFGDGIRLTLRDTSALPQHTTRLAALEKGAAAVRNPRVESPMVQGHGWTAGPTTNAFYNLNDTSDRIVGDRAATISTNGTGGTGYIQKTGLNLDLTGQGLVFWVKATNIASIRAVTLNIGNTDTLAPGWFGSLPVQGGDKAQATENEWTPIYFSMGNAGVNQGVPALSPVTAIRITLQDVAGMPAPTLKLGGMGTFTDRSPAYPGGVISLTFDDTWASHATAAAKMATYGFPGTEYLIQSRVGTAGNLSMQQIRMLKEVYGWEIGSHATNDAAHTDWTTQTLEWVDAELAAQKEWQHQNSLPTDTFAYPIGPFSADIARLAGKYYASARSTYPWTNSPAKPSPHRLSCYVVAASTTLDVAKTYVDRVKANGGWPVLMFHNLVESNPTGNDWLLSDFNALIDHIAASGLPVDTVGNVIRNG